MSKNVVKSGPERSLKVIESGFDRQFPISVIGLYNYSKFVLRQTYLSVGICFSIRLEMR